MTGRVRRRSCAPPSLRDFVAVAQASPAGGPAHLLLSEISSAGAPASPVGGPAHLLFSGISSAVVPASPACGPARLLLSGISSAVASTSPVGGPAHLLLSEISSLALRHLPPPAAGRCKPEKENQRSSELDADFLFSVCGEKEIRTPDTLLEYTRFPGVPLKPLEHLSRTAL